MKFASKLIPTPPSPPDAGKIPDGSKMKDIPGSGGMPKGIPGGPAGEMHAGASAAMSAITAKIAEGMPGGNKNITADGIRAVMDKINLDDYKDENGVVRCPVPKADREKMISDLKKAADNR